MAPRNKNTSNQSKTWEPPMPSLASKPYKIGSVIKQVSEEKHISPMELERRLGLTHRNIYRIFKSKQMAVPMLMRMSEALGVNLFLEYCPNVPPVAEPLQIENERLKQENEQLKKQLRELSPLVDENKVLKGQLDILREVLKAK